MRSFIGYADFHGIPPATQLRILKIINLNRAVPFDDESFDTDLDGDGASDHMTNRICVWADFRVHNGDFPSKILNKTLECSRGVGEDHKFGSLDELVKAINPPSLRRPWLGE